MTTVVNIRDGSPYDVFIGRPSKWGNLFEIGPRCTREQAIKMYEVYIRRRPDLLAALDELVGKRLGCYCSPLPCHGDVLVKLITEQQEPMQLHKLHETLSRLERLEHHAHVYAFAKELHAAGVTEEQLIRKLGARSASPIGRALRCGGWYTMTTKQNISTFSPFSIYQEKGEWFVNTNRDYSEVNRAKTPKGQLPPGVVRFVDGMVLDTPAWALKDAT